MSAEQALARFVIRERLLPEHISHEFEELVRSQNAEPVWAWLLRRNLVDPEWFARGLADRLHLPYAPSQDLLPDASVAALVPEELAVRHQVAPIRATQHVLQLASSNPFDREAVAEVERTSGRQVQLIVASPHSVQEALWRLYRTRETIAQCLAHVAKGGRVAGHGDTPSEAHGSPEPSFSADNPSVERQLLEAVLQQAIQCGAEELRVEPRGESVVVLARIDGVLEEFLRFPKWLEEPLRYAAKLLAGLDPCARNIPQQKAVPLRIAGREGTLEAGTEASGREECVVLRWTDRQHQPAIEELGLDPGDLSKVLAVLQRGTGLLLVASSTPGSRQAILRTLKQSCLRNGRQTLDLSESDSGTMENLSGDCLLAGETTLDRTTPPPTTDGDPRPEECGPAMVLGDIGDRLGAELALQVPPRWLVLATIDGADAVEAVCRLLELSHAASGAAERFALVLAHTSLRKTCRHCRTPDEPEHGLLTRLHLPTVSHCYLRGRGCSRCRHSGYAGQIRLFEVVSVTAEVRELLRQATNEPEVRLALQQARSRELKEQIRQMILEGETTVEEAYRVLASNETLRCPNCGTGRTDVATACAGCDMEPTTFVDGKGNPSRFPSPDGTVATPDPAVPGVTSATPAGPPLRKTPAGVWSPKFDVLVVEDEPDVRRLIQRILERSPLPLTVRTAANGREALDLIDSALPHLVLLDIMMPGMDGFAVCERLRSSVRTAFLPILMITALNSSEHRIRAFVAGTDDYLTKPFSRDELVARIQRILQRAYGYRARFVDEAQQEFPARLTALRMTG